MKERRVMNVAALVISLLIFAADWSGLNKWDPDLFHPKPFHEVWWHFPIVLLVTWIACIWLQRKD